MVDLVSSWKTFELLASKSFWQFDNMMLFNMWFDFITQVTAGPPAKLKITDLDHSEVP